MQKRNPLKALIHSTLPEASLLAPKCPLNRKRPVSSALTLGGPGLGHEFKAEAVPDVTAEVAAVRLSVEERLIMIGGELEIPVDVTASETTSELFGQSIEFVRPFLFPDTKR